MAEGRFIMKKHYHFGKKSTDWACMEDFVCGRLTLCAVLFGCAAEEKMHHLNFLVLVFGEDITGYIYLNFKSVVLLAVILSM